MQLIIPIAGKSTRFSGLRPKWMLTHPIGNFMVTKAISGLNLKDFSKVYFVGLQAHEDEFKFCKGLNEQLSELGIKHKSEIILLKKQTKSQPETIAKVIEQKKLKGFIFIKDSDNYFTAHIKPKNQVCYFSLNDCTSINPKNKSYINLDSNLNILNIVEKKVISPNFSVGGYGIDSAQRFLKTFNNLKSKSPQSEVYISDIIFSDLLEKYVYFGNLVSNYLDWGTIEDWNKYKRSFITLFVDLDGTLMFHSAKYLPPYIGETEPIQKNIDILIRLKNTGRVQVIITTARPKSSDKVTKAQLKKYKIPYDILISGLLHSKRVVINDYSGSNPFKSCDSINIKRNSEELEEMLKDILVYE